MSNINSGWFEKAFSEADPIRTAVEVDTSAFFLDAIDVVFKDVFHAHTEDAYQLTLRVE